ncbi:Alpha/Beta hydrolase protein [Pyrenochaeta sp. MPI-SDFR-AT-0127]|nr:Alpha/Beta hydrolase protein [Pyrenochaeta sp. MPI-SDFR-AT-0127]
MSLQQADFILPRPGAAPGSSREPIPGPSEEAFTATFGKLLPPAKYLTTVLGKAAYYEVPPSTSPGDKSRTPDRVLFIHGVQTPALGMFPLASTLKASFPGAHFVLVDLWGHGLSDTPLIPHEASLFHQLLNSLLDQLEWPSAHLVGYSFGGALTVGYVGSRSPRVQSFTLVAPAGLIRSSNFTVEEQGHLRGDDEAAARKWVLEYLEGGELVVPADWKERVKKGEVVAEAVREWQMREHPGHSASVIAVFRDGGVMDKHAEFVTAVRTGIPSLVVLGGSDGLCNEQELLELGFTNVAVVPQVGHGVVRERASEVAAFISSFWKQLEKIGSD